MTCNNVNSITGRRAPAIPATLGWTVFLTLTVVFALNFAS